MPRAHLSNPIARQSSRNGKFASLFQCERRRNPIDLDGSLMSRSRVRQYSRDLRRIWLPQRIPNKKQAARPKNADHFAKRVAPSRQVVYERIGDCGIEGLVRVGQLAGVRLMDANRDPELRVLNVAIRPLKYRGAAVNANDFNPRLPHADFDRDPGRSGSHVENTTPRSVRCGAIQRSEKQIGKRPGGNGTGNCH